MGCQQLLNWKLKSSHLPAPSILPSAVINKVGYCAHIIYAFLARAVFKQNKVREVLSASGKVHHIKKGEQLWTVLIGPTYLILLILTR